MKVKSLSHVQLFATPWTAAYQAPSMGVSSVGQEATVRTGHGTTDWFQIGKGVRQGCILSSCLFNLYAEYIMRSAGLDEAQAGWCAAIRGVAKSRT